ncbi:MAG: hypothetical protein AABY05_02405 [Nanoarchaeota archaeon]
MTSTKDSQVFPLERILTISASDYLSLKPSYNKGESDIFYQPVGVNVQGCSEAGEGHTTISIRGDSRNYSTLHEAFASRVPREAEVVVGYVNRITFLEYGYGDHLIFTAQGTALIPVKRKGVGECVSLIP